MHLVIPPDRITLHQIFKAIATGDTIFALRQGGNARCPVNQAMKRLLPPIFDQVGTALSATLGKTTLADRMQSRPATADTKLAASVDL